MSQRRFPPPWTAEETEADFVVRDHNGQKLAIAASLLWRRSSAMQNAPWGAPTRYDFMAH
jgi:hypothetical protein